MEKIILQKLTNLKILKIKGSISILKNISLNLFMVGVEYVSREPIPMIGDGEGGGEESYEAFIIVLCPDINLFQFLESLVDVKSNIDLEIVE